MDDIQDVSARTVGRIGYLLAPGGGGGGARTDPLSYEPVYIRWCVFSSLNFLYEIEALN